MAFVPLAVPVAVAPAAPVAAGRRRPAAPGGHGPLAVAVAAAVATRRRAVATAPQVKAETAAWRQYGVPWGVHKFGGASLNDAGLYKRLA